MAHPYTLTVDGYESQFGINHLGHFLFTALIFNRLVAASTPEFPSRIVNVSSRAHHYSDVCLDDYNFSEGKEYNDLLGYAQSKTANILFANELAKRAKQQGLNVLAFSIHPGSEFPQLSPCRRGSTLKADHNTQLSGHHFLIISVQSISSKKDGKLRRGNGLSR